ncbi:unnamed protein product [Hermetia illucens]|uniref:Uncharacterized protein n=1 Tax=Hermetia illucens TaxID=343691 RepID=A0A7R8USH4_HERIL|nr:unnamed protein product [Hermetia illucens]
MIMRNDFLQHLIEIENHVTELKQAIIFSKQGIPDSRLISESEINLKQFTNIKVEKKYFIVNIIPICNKENIKLNITPSQYLVRNKEIFHVTNKETDLVDVKDDCILSILKNLNGTCSFVKSSNRLIESINENMIITQNLQATKIYHNCNNRYKENILGSKVIKFFNCTVEISDFKFEGIPHYKNFMIHTQNNNMTTEIQFVEIDLKKQIVEHINEIKEIKLQNQINSRLNFSTIKVIIAICIITFCYMYVKMSKE